MLNVLDRHQMVCKPMKASLFVKEVEFAGQVVGHGLHRTMPGKLAALNHWGRPTTISELRLFMGFCNYYSPYVRMYAELSEPLHKMLQDGTFETLKRALLGNLGLFLMSPDNIFLLRTDASNFAVGAVLEQVREEGFPCPSGVLEWSFGGGGTPYLDCKGKGDICHYPCLGQVVRAYWFATHCRVHRPSKFAELAQGARRHAPGSGSPTRPVARDGSQV